MAKELVSILIPAFNAEKWIANCVESALTQTWPRKEIIIVDDGSSDSTLSIARSYASSTVQVLAQENAGASVARNHALSIAQGGYIQWLDSDDILAPDKIERQLECTESGLTSRILISGAYATFYDNPQKAKLQSNSLWADLDPTEWLYRKIDGNHWVAIESWLVSRKLTEMAGRWNEDFYRDNDGEYFCRVLSCSKMVKHVNDSICYVRVSNHGISSNMKLNERKLESIYNSLRLYVERLLTLEDSYRTRAACIKLLNRWSIYFYPERMDIFDKMAVIAIELGGKLDKPKLRGKYQWIGKSLGWRIGKKAQFTLPVVRSIWNTVRERFT